MIAFLRLQNAYYLVFLLKYAEIQTHRFMVVLTGIGGIIGIIFAGSFLIEKTFGIDGIGLLGYYALIQLCHL